MGFWLDVVGLLLSTLSAPLLWRGSLGVPWEMQTWKGQTAEETTYKQQTRTSAQFGLTLLGFGFALQLIAKFL